MEIRLQLSQLILLITVTGVFTQDVDLDKIKSQIPETLLPGGFAGVTSSVDEAKNLVKEKCRKQSGNDEAFENLEKGVQSLVQCATGLINASVIQAEIEEARPNGELDTVFHKYCLKRSDAVICVDNFLKTLQPCLTEEEKLHSQLVLRIFRSILNFVCYKGGDHIALFIAEGGPECLQEKRQPITDCVNKTVSAYIPKDGLPSLDNMPQFVFGPKQCKELQDLKTCVVQALETCKEVTPANIVESMFRYVIKNETDCEKKRK